MTLKLTCFAMLRNIVIFGMYASFHCFPSFHPHTNVNSFLKFPIKYNSALKLPKLGMVLFGVAISSCKILPVAAAKLNTTSFPMKFLGIAGKEIQATASDVSFIGSKNGSQLNVHIG